MKICPVCNETFANELRFCDLDGTRLKHQPGTESGSSQGRVWSLLGVGVLLGALVIATLSIIFTPKPNVAPTLASSTPAPATEEQNSSADSTIAATEARSAPATEQPPIVEETAPLAVKKKEKPQEELDPNASLPPLNPKVAAQPDETAIKDAAKAEESGDVASTEPKKIETPPVIKPVSNPRESEASSKSAAAAAEAKKEKDSAKSKDSDKKSDSKKKGKDDEKEKKKGGFLRVFKKIFGKG